jgi:hypothetical protein
MNYIFTIFISFWTQWVILVAQDVMSETQSMMSVAQR